MTFVAELEPHQLWHHFDQILAIPRGSKNEEAIRQYVISVAQSCSLSYQQDSAGNVVISKPGGEGNQSPTVLQCHLDMVNEKNADVDHDFSRDPIRPVKKGEYLTAEGTTLGSDNGIGIAASLALLESSDVNHGALECLFTVDEETGLTGASALSPGLLKGSRLINLDTEEEGALYVGCAGGAGVNLYLPLEWMEPGQHTALEVKLFGLRGGHSGVDIHLQRANAIKLLARALNGIESPSFSLASFSGGNMHNAIPREAFALLQVPAEETGSLKRQLETRLDALSQEYGPADPNLKWSIADADHPTQILSPDSQGRLLDLLSALPHGVLSMSYDIADLVETSSNLATVEISDGTCSIHVSNRSSVDSALTGIQERVAAIGRLAGARVEFGEGYPGWQPDMSSPLLEVARTVHTRVLGREPEVKAVHAGLECGIIKEKYPEMDMISLGPQIEYPHSPDEQVKISSVADFYRLLCAILEELARG